MQPDWLIEAGVYGPEIGPLLDEIRRQGMTVDLVPHRALRPGSEVVLDGRPIGPEACVIGYGTYPFVRQIQVHRRWRPGAWGASENLDCATYYAHFGRFLLNQEYALMRGVEAIRQADRLFSAFGKGGEVFVRPTGCHKLFVGRCVEADDFADALAPARYDPTTLVVVATPRPVAREWRLVVSGDRVVAASRYAEAGTRSIAAGAPDAVLDYAVAMLAEVRWRPDPIFMLDVCESDGQLRLVELNGFGSSWLYGCDLPAVVAEASALAARSWAEGRP